jgi:starch synthase
MYALKYGTIPVVRATGGLRDTVKEFDPRTGTGNGFVFERYAANEMAAALGRAVALYRQPVLWQRLVQNAFAADFSWRRAACEYLRWFEQLSANLQERPAAIAGAQA